MVAIDFIDLIRGVGSPRSVVQGLHCSLVKSATDLEDCLYVTIS